LPPEQIELVMKLQSSLSVHGLPSGVSSHRLFVQLPEQQSLGDAHEPNDPAQHAPCALHRPKDVAQQSAGAAQLSPARLQQLPALHVRGAQQSLPPVHWVRAPLHEQ
jgi:hypothetical protein